MSTVVKDLGAVSAYAYAVEKGYTGTEAEFAELMADYAEVGQRAEDAADSALESKTAAQTAATTATNKATEATTAATTATTKAGEASTSASTATSAKDTAVSASQTATTKATEATTAAATATSAKTDAVAANTAAQSAKTAAQTAQTGAETAAASVSASAAQIATNAADISQLKSDLNEVIDDSFDLVSVENIAKSSEEQGSWISVNPSTNVIEKQSTSGTTYYKICYFSVTEMTHYMAYGAYLKNVPVVVFMDSNDNYINTTDPHFDAEYTATWENVEIKTPANCAKIGINVFGLENEAALTLQKYENEARNTLEYFMESGEKKESVGWEQGNLNGTTGQPIYATNAVRSNDYISDAGTYIIHPNGQKVYVYRFLADGTRAGALGWGITTDFTIEFTSDYKVRLVVMKSNNATFVPSECLVIVGKSTVIQEVKNNIPIVAGDFISICHQGYSVSDSLGHNLLAGYPLAKEKGFDYGECDLKLTSDNVLVCCHDNTFVDATSGDTITIADHTLAELQTYNYYGGTIASFEEVIQSCKLNGLGLVIDQISMTNVDKIMPIVKKYGMQRRVAYLIGYYSEYPTLGQGLFNFISNLDANAYFMVIPIGDDADAGAVEFCNNNITNTNKIALSLNYATHTTADIITLGENLDARASIVIWTNDNITSCKSYLPYVTAITSNKVSTRDLFA